MIYLTKWTNYDNIEPWVSIYTPSAPKFIGEKLREGGCFVGKKQSRQDSQRRRGLCWKKGNFKG